LPPRWIAHPLKQATDAIRLLTKGEIRGKLALTM
jgi:hypothetical protein